MGRTVSDDPGDSLPIPIDAFHRIASRTPDAWKKLPTNLPDGFSGGHAVGRASTGTENRHGIVAMDPS